MAVGDIPGSDKLTVAVHFGDPHAHDYRRQINLNARLTPTPTSVLRSRTCTPQPVRSLHPCSAKIGRHPPSMRPVKTAEQQRLIESEARTKYWKRWGPYLTERAWGTVREDYSANGDAWDYFPHDVARSRAYRWTEDGILGISDNHQRLCFALAFWNGRDPF